ncbi:MAG: lysophospholipid acyltransferase family protein [Candidatus Omnitrophica bacterium]|nr:lysophospholipid acyltransferase family protein [Candidatus Omnitrophota bacterium]
MFFALLYQLGHGAAWFLPRPLSYWIAHRLADHCYRRASKDRAAVRENLKSVLGRTDLPAGAVLSLLGLPVNAVILTHQNPGVDAFFSRQRSRVGVKGIAIQRMSPRQFFETSCDALRRNEILALVGDRDFFGHGLTIPFFGRTLKVPTGPAAFSVKTGAPIVPGFLVREADGSYRFLLEEPLFPPTDLKKGEAMVWLTERCLAAMARVIRQYPTQWYMFQEFWLPPRGLIL